MDEELVIKLRNEPLLKQFLLEKYRIDWNRDKTGIDVHRWRAEGNATQYLEGGLTRAWVVKLVKTRGTLYRCTGTFTAFAAVYNYERYKTDPNARMFSPEFFAAVYVALIAQRENNACPLTPEEWSGHPNLNKAIDAFELEQKEARIYWTGYYKLTAASQE